MGRTKSSEFKPALIGAAMLGSSNVGSLFSTSSAISSISHVLVSARSSRIKG